MINRKALLKKMNKDVISVLISIIDHKTDQYYLHTTDRYLLEGECEWRAIAVGYKIKFRGVTYKVTELNLDFALGGLTTTPTPKDNTVGIKNPYSAILNVYVRKLAR